MRWAAHYDELMLGPSQLSVLDRELIAFAVKLTRAQQACSARDLARLRRHGFSDEACWDILETAAMFNFTNRIAAASGVRPDPEYRRMGRGSRARGVDRQG